MEAKISAAKSRWLLDDYTRNVARFLPARSIRVIRVTPLLDIRVHPCSSVVPSGLSHFFFLLSAFSLDDNLLTHRPPHLLCFAFFKLVPPDDRIIVMHQAVFFRERGANNHLPARPVRRAGDQPGVGVDAHPA